MFLALLVGVFQQHAVGRVLVQRYAQLRKMPVHQLQRKLRHHLETSQAGTESCARQVQQLHRGLYRRHGGPGGQLRLGLRVELERGCGDHTQRAFAADVQVAQVVAGIVLAQAGQHVQHFALRRHHFQAQAEFTCIAVAQHLRAAGIGAEVAANRAAAFRSHAEWKQPAGFGRGLLQLLQDTASFHRDGLVRHVDLAHALHALQAQHDVATVRFRRRAADQAGIAALRHDGHAGCGASPHHGRHFRRRTRPGYAERLAAITLAPVLQMWLGIVAGQHMGSAQ